MSTGILQRRSAGPFYTRRWLYRLGVHWVEEMELEEGYTNHGTDHLPHWVQRPYAGVTGTWMILRHRLQWHAIPITPWLEGPARNRLRYALQPDGTGKFVGP